MTERGTEIFQRYAQAVWTTEERTAFVNWIAVNPMAGDVIPDSNGCRKVRWSRGGTGKRGGVRVVYAKAKFDNLPPQFFAKLRYEVEHG